MTRLSLLLPLALTGCHLPVAVLTAGLGFASSEVGLLDRGIDWYLSAKGKKAVAVERMPGELPPPQ